MCTFIWALKLFAAFTFDDMKKKKKYFRSKSAFLTELLNRPAFNNHFTHLLYIYGETFRNNHFLSQKKYGIFYIFNDIKVSREPM